jgi:hypothetical protein
VVGLDVFRHDTERVEGHGQQAVGADREDQVHPLALVEVLAERGPGLVRQGRLENLDLENIVLKFGY